MVLSNAGGRLLVRGRCGLTSTMSSRSGSRPAAQQFVARPAHVQREVHLALLVGGAACATMTRGANRAMIGAI